MKPVSLNSYRGPPSPVHGIRRNNHSIIIASSKHCLECIEASGNPFGSGDVAKGRARSLGFGDISRPKFLRPRKQTIAHRIPQAPPRSTCQTASETLLDDGSYLPFKEQLDRFATAIQRCDTLDVPITRGVPLKAQHVYILRVRTGHA